MLFRSTYGIADDLAWSVGLPCGGEIDGVRLVSPRTIDEARKDHNGYFTICRVIPFPLRIKLGLDLQGGMRVVLEVNTIKLLEDLSKNKDDVYNGIMSEVHAIAKTSDEDLIDIFQKKFQEKYALPFPLLSDPDHAVQEAWGAWGKKNMYGKTVMGIERTTFVIGEDGRIRKIFPKVKPEGHAKEVLAAL